MSWLIGVEHLTGEICGSLQNNNIFTSIKRQQSQGQLGLRKLPTNKGVNIWRDGIEKRVKGQGKTWTKKVEVQDNLEVEKLIIIRRAASSIPRWGYSSTRLTTT